MPESANVPSATTLRPLYAKLWAKGWIWNSGCKRNYFRSSNVSSPSTLSVRYMPYRFLTTICMPPRRRRIKCNVDSLRTSEWESVRASSSCLPPKMSLCWSGEIPSLRWILALISPTVSNMPAWMVIVFPVRVLTKISIEGLRKDLEIS
ncbi:hypothetical protein ABFS82_10G092700 [Erythranthe guttata]